MIDFFGKEIFAAIFDMDGTMFDTERLRITTLQQASSELFHSQFSESFLHACLGLSAASAQKMAQQTYGDDIPYAQIRARADILELEYVRSHGVPIKSGLLEVLVRLRQHGLKLAVATSSKRAIAEEYLINADVFKYFDVIVCGDEVENGKPAPEIFLTAASKINVDPAQCLMFEDSQNGLQSACDAGGLTILLQDIKQPSTDMLKRADFFYTSLSVFLRSLDTVCIKKNCPNYNSQFPQAFNQYKVAIHGFGAMGGGYVAQILNHWDGYTRPQMIYATTSDQNLAAVVNGLGKYSIRFYQKSHDVQIDNLFLIDAQNQDQLNQMYLQSDLLALCLPEKAYTEVIQKIATALIFRAESHHKNLHIMLIMNKVGAKKWLLNLLEVALLQQSNKQTTQNILQHLHIAECVANRMVSKLSSKELFRQVRIRCQKMLGRIPNSLNQFITTDHSLSAQLKASAQDFSAYLNFIKQSELYPLFTRQFNLVLFRSETDMLLYAENCSDLISNLIQVYPVENIGNVQFLKNRLWNGPHCLLAWYGLLKGCDSIAGSYNDPEIFATINHFVDHEVIPNLSDKFPQHQAILSQLKADFYSACASAFKDPCKRVAKDPIRKLQCDERIFWTIFESFKRHGYQSSSVDVFLSAIRYAMTVAPKSDLEAQFIRQSLLKGSSLSVALKHDVSKIDVLDREAYNALMQQAEQTLKADYALGLQNLSA